MREHIKNTEVKPAGAEVNPLESPAGWALPVDPPFITNEAKPKRNRRHDRQLSRKPIAERIADAKLSAAIELSWAKGLEGNKREELRRDVHLGWYAFHATRAVILAAMNGPARNQGQAQ